MSEEEKEWIMRTKDERREGLGHVGREQMEVAQLAQSCAQFPTCMCHETTFVFVERLFHQN